MAVSQIFLYFLAQFHAVHIGHHNVRNNNVYVVVLQQFQRLYAVTCTEYIVIGL